MSDQIGVRAAACIDELRASSISLLKMEPVERRGEIRRFLASQAKEGGHDLKRFAEAVRTRVPDLVQSPGASVGPDRSAANAKLSGGTAEPPSDPIEQIVALAKGLDARQREALVGRLRAERILPPAPAPVAAAAPPPVQVAAAPIPAQRSARGVSEAAYRALAASLGVQVLEDSHDDKEPASPRALEDVVRDCGFAPDQLHGDQLALALAAYAGPVDSLARAAVADARGLYESFRMIFSREAIPRNLSEPTLQCLRGQLDAPHLSNEVSEFVEPYARLARGWWESCRRLATVMGRIAPASIEEKVPKGWMGNWEAQLWNRYKEECQRLRADGFGSDPEAVRKWITRQLLS